jgi:hypothetical protein
MFEDRTTQQLRDEYTAYTRAEQATTERLPLPDATPPGLTEDQQSQLFDNWIAHLDKRDPKSFTSKERAAYQFAIVRALRTL